MIPALIASAGLTATAQPALEAVRHDAAAITFRVATETNLLYILDETSALESPWMESAVFSGTGRAVALTNELSGEARFFRARAVDLVSKPGTPLELRLALPNSPAQWTFEGELPEGISFAGGIFSGTPSAAAAERFVGGNYPGVLTLSIPGIGEQLTRSSSAPVLHHVKLSFSRNIYPARPDGPSFGTICLKCHGSGFPPDFSPSAASLLGARSGTGGSCPDTWDYLKPSDPAGSLIYLKLTGPPCGDRMPQGGPYLSPTQIARLARWIAELAPGETD